MAKRIIVHWTAGANLATDLDKKHYHFIVDGTGKVVTGNHSVEDNNNTNDGNYAAHTKGCNTGSIGVSLAGMRGAIETPFESGPSPINRKQWDAMIGLVAGLARKYKIPVTRQTILTHAEVEPTLRIKQRGKWDITRLPFEPKLQGALVVGDWMRKQVADA